MKMKKKLNVLLILTACLAAAPALAAAPHGALPAAASPASSASAAGVATAAIKGGKKTPAPPVKLVDINSAGLQQLKTLPGIGDAEAKKIIANRPYRTKTELVTKGVLPTGPFLSLKRQVVAMPPKKPAKAHP